MGITSIRKKLQAAVLSTIIRGSLTEIVRSEQSLRAKLHNKYPVHQDDLNLIDQCVTFILLDTLFHIFSPKIKNGKRNKTIKM